MDGVMVVTELMMNEVDGMKPEDYSKDCVMLVYKAAHNHSQKETERTD